MVLFGAGGCFCSGLDFSTFGAMADEGLDAESEEVAAAARDLSPAGANRAQQMAKHQGIVDALLVRDAKKASDALVAHLRHAIVNIEATRAEDRTPEASD